MTKKRILIVEGVCKMKKIIGRNIKKLRENANFTQALVSRFLNVDQSLISKVENGERALSADLIEKLSSLFGIPIDELENPNMENKKLTIAFRSESLTSNDMETICAINSIALNSEFMAQLLGGK